MNWRNGKAGFVGALKYFIKGVFQYQHTVTTAVVVQEPTEIILISDTGRTVEVNALGRKILIPDEGRTIEMPE